ncbi:MAG: sulfurtransferase complex subunit TusC [Oleiphilus sp.]
MKPNEKKILIVQSHAPYGSSNIQESLDLILAAGTFDQNVSLLIEDDACYQLMSNQAPENTSQKNTQKMLNALPVFGIEAIYVCQKSAEQRNINTDEKHYKRVTASDILNLYQHADTVIRF